MKNVLKNLKVVATVPNENINIEFHIEEVSYEANLQEITETYKACKDIMNTAIDKLSAMLENEHVGDMENVKLHASEEIRKYEAFCDIDIKKYKALHPKEGKE
jgi:hypothetical protein